MTSIRHITNREAALERENERLLQALRISSFTVETQAEEIAKLKADAERYRFVRDELVWVFSSDDKRAKFSMVLPVEVDDSEHWDNLDNVVDAAMKESKS